ncbi:hypothetical protein C2845_PM05G01760 [Panicum miliaceum]|uniref:Uncharacterized protein n=1 Tax=Panicum miliaceum TaxID=4540 RepID=A0A3L6SXQ5_PANMI|nr:hypothetical protein C2845_PM05G01760 [Panicum miliaceum]
MANRASAIIPAECEEQLQISKRVAAHGAIEETVISIGGGSEKELELCNGKTKEVLDPEADIIEIRKKIHRFPLNLTRLGTDGGYITPRAMALGPYYHGKPELQAMEEVKRKAVDYFEGLPESQEAALERMKSISGQARGCYADAAALQGITDDDFVSMMFVDGCFLVQFMAVLIVTTKDDRLKSLVKPHTICIMRDMMLLENHVPWTVIEFFMALRADLLPMELFVGFVFTLHGTGPRDFLSSVDIDKNYRPSHLLGFFRFYLVGNYQKPVLAVPQEDYKVHLTTNAAELAGMGIKLKAREIPQLCHMSITKGPLFAKLSVSPLSLDSTSICWLVNMAALELYDRADCVNSYLTLLALMMKQEDDVRELRAKGIIHGFFADRQILELINALAPDLSPGQTYALLIMSLAEYRHKRRHWIAVYRFFCNNAKAIAAVLPIVGVLVGILKTLLSLKQKQQ